MRSILKSTAVLSGGWGVSLVLGLASAKVTASLVGPLGVGFLGLLQSTLGLGILAAMMTGVNAAVVRAIPAARQRSDQIEEAGLRAAAWRLCALSISAAVIVMVAFRVPIARFMLGRADASAAIVLLSLAVALTVVASLQGALLTSYRRVNQLAALSVWNSILAPALLIALVYIWREHALVWGVLGGACANFLVSYYFVRRVPAPAVSVPRELRTSSIRTLLRTGIPFNGSAVVGNGMLFALPVLVLHTLGAHAVGLYRAATGISQMYLGFLAPSLSQDYYPRVAACANDTVTLNKTINDQMRVLLVIVGPIVLAGLTLVPYLVPLIYTREFAPAARVLEWQMLGDILRVMASAMAFGILARSGGTTLFAADSANAVLTLVATTILLRVIGLEGMGIAYLFGCCAGYIICLMILRHVSGFRVTRGNQFYIAAFVGAGIVIRALSLAGFGRLRIIVGLGFAAAAALASWRIVRTELHGMSEAATASFSGN